MIKISIITVTYNDSRRLKTTLDSMKNYYDKHYIEHLILDNNSTDNTAALVKKYKFKNLKFIKKSDKGIYDAMNNGISLTNGNFILFLNAGDKILIKPHTLKKILNSVPHEKDIIIFSFIEELSESKQIYHYPKINTHISMPTSHQAMIFKYNFLRKNKFNLKYKIAADFDLFKKTNKTKIYYVSPSKALTIVESNGLASSNPAKSYYEYFKIIKKHHFGILLLYLLPLLLIKALSVILAKKLINNKDLFEIKIKFNKFNKYNKYNS